MSFPAADVFWNLVIAAETADGISQLEEDALGARAMKLGLPHAEAEGIRQQALSHSPRMLKISTDVARRWQSITGMLEVVAADGKIKPRELAVVDQIARRHGLT